MTWHPLSQDRVAVAAPTYEQARFHAREMGLLGLKHVVLVSLNGHPGSIAGMSLRDVHLVGDMTAIKDSRVLDMLRHCQETYKRRLASTPEIS